MDENIIYLIIDVNYANSKFKIKKENLTSYDELREESIKYFNIDIKNGDNIEFIYTDEDKEKNILEHNDENIFSAANLIDDNYLLNLDLIIINNKKPNIENKININENQVNKIEVKRNHEEKRREINNNSLENKMKQIGFLFQKQFNSMKNDISKMINKKYKEIENQLTKLNTEVNNKNNNEIIEKKRIERANKHYIQNKNKNQKENKSNKINENKNKNFKILDGNEEIILKEDNKNEDYMIIEKSAINLSPKKINKVDDDFGFFNNFVDSDESDEGEENILDKDDNIHGSNLFSSNNKKKLDKKYGKIMKNINKLYKNKNYSYNDIKTKGSNIFEIMNNDNEMQIGVIDINKHIKHFLTEGYNKRLSLNEKIKYYNILKYLNHFLEIKKVQVILDDNLKEEIELEIEIENSKEKKKQKVEENIKDENTLISFIDSFNKNSNKEYVQQKIEILIKNLHIK